VHAAEKGNSFSTSQSAKRQTCHRFVCNKQNDVRTVSFVHKNTFSVLCSDDYDDVSENDQNDQSDVHSERVVHCSVTSTSKIQT